MYRRLFILFIVFTIPVFSACFAQSAQLEKEVFNKINSYRLKKGLNELKYLDAAAVEAYKHSKRMANRSVPFGHSGFNTRFNRIKKKYPAMMGYAENVAYGAQDAEEVVDMWLHSSGHKKNIRGNYTHTGVGIARNRRGVLYYTQIFVRID